MTSLHYTKVATSWADQLLVVDPKCYDAHVATGFSKYIIGSMSAPVRWLVRLGGISGDKKAGISELQLTADHGRYLAPFARILLAIAYVREKDRPRAREILFLCEMNSPQILYLPRKLRDWITSTEGTDSSSSKSPCLSDSSEIYTFCNRPVIFPTYNQNWTKSHKEELGDSSLSTFVSRPGAACFRQTTLNGAGATFPYPMYSKWFSEYHKLHPDVEINYQSIGSGGGIRQVLAGTVDFGASDGPMTDEQLSQAKTKILHIPTVLGAVVPAYNIPGVTGRGEVYSGGLAGIFLGKITSWNDRQSSAQIPE